MPAIAERSESGRLTVEQYFAFLRTRPHGEHWQLIDGVAVMMNPPNVVHQTIAMNFAFLLNQKFKDDGRDLIALIELGLTIPGHESFLPEVDLVVLDTPVAYEAYAGRFYLTAEILSDSNTQEYMSLKLERYIQHPDNLYSLIIGQRERRVELWARASGWKGGVFRSPDDLLDFPEFGFRCQLRDLYRGTPLA